MPSLKCTYREVIGVLLVNGFVLHHHRAGSKRIYRNKPGRLVTVAAHDFDASLSRGTLKSIIRQSGIRESLFEKQIRALKTSYQAI